MKCFFGIFLSALAAVSAPDGRKLEFEVASVKPAEMPAGSRRGAGLVFMLDSLPAGMLPLEDSLRLHIAGWPLRHLIAAAYRVRSDRVSGPKWMEEEFFDIDARLPAGAKGDDAHEMLQTLLAERFGLELHPEPHESPGFALVVGKRGAHLDPYVPPAKTPDGGAPVSLEERQKQAEENMRARMQERAKSGPPKPGLSRMSWRGMTAARLADRLSTLLGGPVVDETGLNGQYNVTIETWRASDTEPEQTVFDALEKLGLKLIPRKMPVETLVIDKLMKTPTAN